MREIETINITTSKQMCSKPIAPMLWHYDEIANHWDELKLNSTIVNSGNRESYQSGSVSSLRSPSELIELYNPQTAKLSNGTLMFCGTLAVDGGIRPGEIFEATLLDPVLNREISFSYRTEVIPAEEWPNRNTP